MLRDTDGVIQKACKPMMVFVFCSNFSKVLLFRQTCANDAASNQGGYPKNKQNAFVYFISLTCDLRRYCCFLQGKSERINNEIKVEAERRLKRKFSD